MPIFPRSCGRLTATAIGQPVSAPRTSSVSPETTRPWTAGASRRERLDSLVTRRAGIGLLVEGDARGEPQLGQERGRRGKHDQGNDARGGGGRGDRQEGVTESGEQRARCGRATCRDGREDGDADRAAELVAGGVEAG